MKLTTGAVLTALIFTLNFCGCGNSQNKINTDTERTTETLTYSGSKISVDEIKGKYDYDKDNLDSIMPLYNVSKDEQFTFDFKSDLTEDSSIGLYDAVTVHTDKECKDESKIYYYADLDKAAQGSQVRIRPMEPVLKTSTDSKNYINDKCTWGSAPMLYIAIHYDQDSDGIKKLDKPIIIPFTVKSDVEVPNVKAVVGTDGVYKLKWDPVEGADHYVVYSLTNGTMTTGVNNPDIDGEKNAYANLSMVKVGETDNTEFAEFAGEKGGVASMHDGAYVIGQNYSVNSTYYVTAVAGDKESNLSAACRTAGLKLPYKVEDSEDISNERYKDVSEMPLQINVKNIDGSSSKRNILYKLESSDNSSLGSRAEYKYSIEGTAITGYVVITDYDNSDKKYPETVGTESSSGNNVPEDNINKSPDSSVDTIIDGEDTKQSDADKDKNKDKDKDKDKDKVEEDVKDDSLVSAQRENTKKHNDSGKDTRIETPEKGVYVNAESPEEEWLALNMAAGNEEISLEAFPKLQDPYALKDAFYKVYYQNPFILGICAFSYDYKTFNFKIEYSYSKDEMKKMQKELVEKSSKIEDEIIKDDMSDDEKRLAIYNYLVDNAEYDMDALEDCKNSGYEKKKGSKFEDSFNAYGVLVKNKGVCMSYAEGYKLLSDLAGVECRVATGYLDGNLPHAWNMVNINDEWYQLDSTNNAKTAGVPYFLYDASSKIAEQTSFTLDDLFESDDNINKFSSRSDEYEYYTKNKLAADNLNDYGKILEQEVDSDTDKIIVRYIGTDFNQSQFVNVVRESLNKKGMEGKLKEAGYIYKNGFLILNFNAKE